MAQEDGPNESETAGTAAKPVVFLSYARVDRARAAALAHALEAAGFDVWWDAQIKGGDAFAERIETALERADAVVVAWSQAAVASDWVRDEAGHARDHKRLVPVSLDGTPPPLGFKQYHALDLSAWRGAAQSAETNALIAAIRTRIGEEIIHKPATPPRLELWSRRNLVLACGAAGVVALGGGFALWRGLAAPKVDLHSIAVQTFGNFTGDPQQAYFSDGLSDDLRAALARDSRLKVMGQSSTTAAGADPLTIAHKLDVAFVLNGGVERAGDDIRISAHLTDASGRDAWAQTFPGQVKNIFTIQDQIAAVVLAALTQQGTGAKPVTPPPTGGKPYGGTTDVNAYQAYLRGRELYQSDAGDASDHAALAQFGVAVATDPAFATARAARARALAAIANSDQTTAAKLRSLYDQAIAEATRAATDAPDSAYIQATLGQMLLEGRLDVRAAQAPFDKAYTLSNNDASALTYIAHFAAQTGQADEALKAIARAQEIDPLNPLVYRLAGLIRIAGRQFDQALPPLLQSLALQPKQEVAHAAIALVYLQQGRLDDARKAWQAEPNDALRLSGLAIVEKRMGQDKAAQVTFDGLVSSGGDGVLYQQAQVKAQWGDAEAAMQLLLRAKAIPDAGLLDMKTDVLLDPLRPDPRFAGLLADIGFS